MSEIDVESVNADLDKIVTDIKTADVHDVAGDLIENLEGHLLSVRMRVGNIADRISNHSKET